MVLVELGLVEQRYSAVCEVLRDGATVTDVAKRYGVARQTVHVWLRRYADEGMPGLVDGSSKPLSCPHQMTPETEAAIDAGKLDASQTIDEAAPVAAGLVRRVWDGVRILGRGEITSAVTLDVTGASASAVAAVEKAGGKPTVKASTTSEASE